MTGFAATHTGSLTPSSDPWTFVGTVTWQSDIDPAILPDNEPVVLRLAFTTLSLTGATIAFTSSGSGRAATLPANGPFDGSTDVAVADGGTGASNKAGAQANLGIPVVPMTVVGGGGGNHTTTSSTFADVNAAYSVAMPAVAGDLLEMEFQVQVFQTNAGNQARFKFAVAGTLIANMPTNGLFFSVPDTNSHWFRCSWVYVVQSGDISGGTVTVRPQFATDSGTLTVRNDGTNGKPLFVVRNWRQCDMEVY